MSSREEFARAIDWAALFSPSWDSTSAPSTVPAAAPAEPAHEIGEGVHSEHSLEDAGGEKDSKPDGEGVKGGGDGDDGGDDNNPDGAVCADRNRQAANMTAVEMTQPSRLSKT